jgi:hypothetical protein
VPPDKLPLVNTNIAHNNLLFLSTTSHSYAIDIGSHQQVWSYPAGGTLALSSQGLFIAQQSGRLAAIKVPVTSPMTIRRRSSRAMAATLLALAACSDSTSPRASLDVKIALASTGGPTMSSDADGNPQVACQLNFSLTASGKVNATWEDAIYRFYVGKDRTTPVDTLLIPSSDIAQGWGAQITPGEGSNRRGT